MNYRSPSMLLINYNIHMTRGNFRIVIVQGVTSTGGGPSMIFQIYLKVSNKISQAQNFHLDIFDETQRFQ